MEIEKDKRIQLYGGDQKQGIIKKKILENILGVSFTLAELELVGYEELLQLAVKYAYERNPNYYDEDKVTAFLYWYDGYLFDVGEFSWSKHNGNHELYLSHFFYTNMSKYKDVISETIFGRRLNVYVLKTTRPTYVKIINHLKQDTAIQSSASVSETSKNE